jgi:hypothetical protein
MSAREKKELATLARMPDSEIDTSDIPEIADWSKAQVRRYDRSPKRAKHISTLTPNPPLQI